MWTPIGCANASIASVRRVPPLGAVPCDDGSTSAATLAALESIAPSIPNPCDPPIHKPRHRRRLNRAAGFATGQFSPCSTTTTSHPDALLKSRALDRAPSSTMLTRRGQDRRPRPLRRSLPQPAGPRAPPERHVHPPPAVVRKSVFDSAASAEFSGAQDYDLALRVTSLTSAWAIPKVLYHWRKIRARPLRVDAKPQALTAGRRALEDFVRANRLPAKVEPGLLPGLFRVKYRVAGKPNTLLIISGVKEAELPAAAAS